MLLTLEKIESKLIELNITTKEAIIERKKIKKYGKSNCFSLRKFQNAVKRNYRDFFPEPPDMKNFNRFSSILTYF